jgi:hypothetical protein
MFAEAKKIGVPGLPVSHCVRPDGFCSLDNSEIRTLTGSKFMSTIKAGYTFEDFVAVGCHSAKLQGYGTATMSAECLVWYGLAPKSNPKDRIDVACTVRYDLGTGNLTVNKCTIDTPNPANVSTHPGNISVPYRAPVSLNDLQKLSHRKF